MKKFISLLLLGFVLIGGIYYAFIYFVPFSEGVRSGELIKLAKVFLVLKYLHSQYWTKTKMSLKNLKNIKGNMLR